MAKNEAATKPQTLKSENIFDTNKDVVRNEKSRSGSQDTKYDGENDTNLNDNQPNLTPIKVEDSQTTFDDSVKTVNVFGKECEVEDEYLDYITVKEVKSLLPKMDEEKFQEFKKSMENGNIIPILYILLPNGYKLIIDGHHRFRAAIELKLEKILTKRVGQDYKRFEQIITFIIKDQLAKRNLSPIQKLLVAYQNKDVFIKLAKDNLSLAGKNENVTEKINTALEIGKLADCGKSKAEDFILVMESGSDTLKKQMLEDEISVHAAAESIRDARRKAKTTKAEVEKKDTKIDSKPISKIEKINEDVSVQDAVIKSSVITTIIEPKEKYVEEITEEASGKEENTKPTETTYTKMDNEEPLEIIERLLNGELAECFKDADDDFRGFIEVYGEIIIVNSYSDIRDVIAKFNNKGKN